MSSFRSASTRSRETLPTHWDRVRLPIWLRLMVLAAVAYAAVLCVHGVVGYYQDERVYRDSPVCPVDSSQTRGASCLRPESGTVRDMRTGESCTNDANSYSCNTYYEVRLARVAATEWIAVAEDTYRDARLGDPAELLTWHGSVVRMVLRGHTDEYPTPSASAMPEPLAELWLLLGVAVWAVLSGRLDRLIAFGNFGWVWMTIPVACFVQGVLLGEAWWWLAAMAALSAYGAAWMLGAWEIRFPYRVRRWWYPRRLARWPRRRADWLSGRW